jgi:hypothetical protein
MNRVDVLERLVLPSSGGILFWDPPTRQPVSSGLVVTHRPEPGDAVVTAVRNRLGVHVLHGIPGAASGPARRYRIEMTDQEDRFLPLAFDVELPAARPGRAGPVCAATASPPGPGQPVVPVFSGPARPLPAGLAVLRAQVCTTTGEPASWALLRVSAQGRELGAGVADPGGLATVIFPGPEPAFPSLSPPGAGPHGLPDQTWDLGLEVCFGDRPVAGATAIPDLCDLLAQPPATALADQSGAPLSTVRLRYGRELVVRTSPGSTLLVVPSGSPPRP